MPGKKRSQSIMFGPQPGAAAPGSGAQDFGSNAAMIGRLAAASQAEASAAGVDVNHRPEKSIDEQIHEDFVAHLTGGTASQSLQ